ERLAVRLPRPGGHRRRTHRQHRRTGVADQLSGPAGRRHPPGHRQRHQHRRPGAQQRRLGERVPARAAGPGTAAAPADGRRRAGRRGRRRPPPRHAGGGVRADRPVPDRRCLAGDPRAAAAPRTRDRGSEGAPRAPRSLVAGDRHVHHRHLRRLLRRGRGRPDAGDVPARHRRGPAPRQRDEERRPRCGERDRRRRLHRLRLDRVVRGAPVGPRTPRRRPDRSGRGAPGTSGRAAPGHRRRRPRARRPPRHPGLRRL
ncbi:MAG: Uncharacterized UPF0721 integral membrane protein, partial [uncultured Blastococcus sp.]